MAVRRHALQRSLQALAFGIKSDMDKKAAADAQDALAERDHQFQLPISGTAPTHPNDCVWTQIDLKFETIFPGPTAGMRDPDFEVPQVSFGYDISSVNPVAVHACVYRWTKNGQGDITGCRLAVTAFALGSTHGDDIDFNGTIHVTFQGWGAPEETFDDSQGGRPSLPASAEVGD